MRETCLDDNHSYVLTTVNLDEQVRICQKCGTSAILTNRDVDGEAKLVWVSIGEVKS